MNPLIGLKRTAPRLLTILALLCFGLLPTAKALLPAPSPDGGYPGGNTAEGINALHDVNTAVGINNTAVGLNALLTIRPAKIKWRFVPGRLRTTPLATLTWPLGRKRSR